VCVRVLFDGAVEIILLFDLMASVRYSCGDFELVVLTPPTLHTHSSNNQLTCASDTVMTKMIKQKKIITVVNLALITIYS